MSRQMKQQFSDQLFVLLLMYKSLEMKFGQEFLTNTCWQFTSK